MRPPRSAFPRLDGARRHRLRPLGRPVRAGLGALLATALSAGLLIGVDGGVPTGSSGSSDSRVEAAPAASTTNPVTPGDFTGYGFDQCLAPTQRTMDTWLQHSPFLAVGIYISGDSRACRSQPNLTPEWVSTQLAKGWRLLPITLGPQASCQPRFPRYSDDFKISSARGKGNYSKARKMGQNSAISTVADAKRLGITPGSTLWYDLEGFDSSNTDCRESALAFLSAWVTKTTSLGYVTGVYSSAGSGIKALDDARVNRPNAFAYPQRVWVARWDGVANTSTSYLRADGWRPGGRVKQYRGGHDETWGGTTINIDSNFLDLGKGTVAGSETHCGGIQLNFSSYPSLRQRTSSYTPSKIHVKALQCLLREQGVYSGPTHGGFGQGVTRAVKKWQTARGVPASGVWYGRDWITMLSYGDRPVLKTGSAGSDVRRVQRALNAARLGSTVQVDGRFTAPTDKLVRSYQRKVGVAASGVVNAATWARLGSGNR